MYVYDYINLTLFWFVYLIIKAMKNSDKQNFLLDGFPRNKENVDGWNKTIGDKVNIQCVLFFDCDEKV
jgi:UMP-CMP kinase